MSGVIINTFRDIEDVDNFVEFVGQYFRNAPDQLQPALGCTIEVDNQRLVFAHAAYMQGVNLFSVILQSGDPDHYKRSGALLHALYLGKLITGTVFDPPLDEVDTISTAIGVCYHESEAALGFGRFFSDYSNEFMSFSLAFNLCYQYDPDPRPIAFGYLHTICTYLSNNRNLSVESLFVLFKSLMH